MHQQVGKARPQGVREPIGVQGLETYGRYRVPWFVTERKPDGSPEFRVIRIERWLDAVRFGKCWVCGHALFGRRFEKVTDGPPGVVGAMRGELAFLIGPMCAINRISGDPPMHPGCARYSVQVCPFLLTPDRERREIEEGSPHHGQDDPTAIPRNPGVSLVWRTDRAALIRGGERFLLRVGDPTDRRISPSGTAAGSEAAALEWYREGRPATVSEVHRSVLTGLPILIQRARDEGLEALAELRASVEAAIPLFRTAKHASGCTYRTYRHGYPKLHPCTCGDEVPFLSILGAGGTRRLHARTYLEQGDRGWWVVVSTGEVLAGVPTSGRIEESNPLRIGPFTSEDAARRELRGPVRKIVLEAVRHHARAVDGTIEAFDLDLEPEPKRDARS